MVPDSSPMIAVVTKSGGAEILVLHDSSLMIAVITKSGSAEIVVLSDSSPILVVVANFNLIYQLKSPRL